MGKPPNSRRTRQPDQMGTMQQLVRISTIGTNFAFGVGAGVLLGWGLQKWVVPSWAPWPLIVGAALAIVGAGIRFVREARALMGDGKEQADRSGT